MAVENRKLARNILETVLAQAEVRKLKSASIASEVSPHSVFLPEGETKRSNRRPTKGFSIAPRFIQDPIPFFLIKSKNTNLKNDSQ